MNLIPGNRNLNKRDFSRFNKEDIEDLQTYIQETSFQWFSDYDFKYCKVVLDLIDVVIHKIPNDTTVIVPGESPFKFVQLIKLIYGIGGNLYRYDCENECIEKKLTFVEFPISGLKKLLMKDKNDFIEYFYEQMKDYLPVLPDEDDYIESIPNVYLLDYSDRGASFELILEAMYSKFNYGISNMDIRHYVNKLTDVKDEKETEEMNKIIGYYFINSEVTDCRCQKKFEINMENKDITNIKRCNAYIAFFYFLYTGEINESFDVVNNEIFNEDIDF